MEKPEGIIPGVIKPGSYVKMGNITGMVSQICICVGLELQYEVIWWDGMNRKKEWVEQFEVEPVLESEYISIGFQPII